MLKRLLTAIAFLCLSQISFSQCAIQTWTLQKRVDLSNLVVEGKVMDQYCFRETRKLIMNHRFARDTTNRNSHYSDLALIPRILAVRVKSGTRPDCRLQSEKGKGDADYTDFRGYGE